MFRTFISITLIVIVYSIHFSNAANCTSATFNHDLDVAKVTLSKINVTDYAAVTGDQIGDQLKELFNETVVHTNCTVTKTNNVYSIAYKIIYGCNDTTSTVLSNGTTKTVQTNTKLNQTKVHELISCGLFEF